MKSSTYITSISFLAIIISTQLNGTDIQDGKTLYTEANCQKCHNRNGKFNKVKHKVKNINNLASWVAACDSTLEIGWFPDEQKKVIEYLNETSYRY